MRPCALTYEDPGAGLVLGQGDSMKGKISRADVAELCVAALGLPQANRKTFEVFPLLSLLFSFLCFFVGQS